MLSSKLALITGAGSGIGRATCLLFAKEKAKVIAVDRKAECVTEIKKYLAMDVSQASSIMKVSQEILKTYQEPPSIIVNCAGIIMDDFIVNMKEECFDKVIDVNLKGTYLVLQTFSKLLIERNLKGSIVNIGSIIGKIGNIGQCNYSASKAGVELITKTAAKELGKYGIRCNTVLPGFIKTPMTENVPDKVKDSFTKIISLGRFGEPEEVAEVIAFLASTRSSYINGASIEVTGGGL